MREIKFRAWDGEKMTPAFCMGSYLSMNYMGRLMQYTGLKDKNGKEIYEGDVVKWKCGIHYGTSRISFSDGSFRLTDYFNQDENNITQYWMKKYTEVIGNIYENPELNENTPS